MIPERIHIVWIFYIDILPHDMASKFLFIYRDVLNQSVIHTIMIKTLLYAHKPFYQSWFENIIVKLAILTYNELRVQAYILNNLLWEQLPPYRPLVVLLEAEKKASSMSWWSVSSTPCKTSTLPLPSALSTFLPHSKVLIGIPKDALYALIYCIFIVMNRYNNTY